MCSGMLAAGDVDDTKECGASTNAIAKADAAPRAKRTTSTNDVSATAAKPVRQRRRTPANRSAMDYSSFRSVTDRNIFNANRSRRPSRGFARWRSSEAGLKSTPFLLSGFWVPARRLVPFSMAASVALSQGCEGWPIPWATSKSRPLLLRITFFCQLGEQKFTLEIGEQLRREDNGEWERKTSPSAVNCVYASQPAGHGRHRRK